jgi:hypothetical protein
MSRYTEADLKVYQARVSGGVVRHPVGPSNSTPRSMGRHEVQDVGTFPVVGLNPTHSPYKSKWEEQMAYELTIEKRIGTVKQWWYEPFSLWLPGGIRYKPDFLVQYADQLVYPTHICAPPQLEIREIKGWSKNRRDGITRLKIAAALFPCFVWRMMWRNKGDGWDGKYITP